MSNPIKTWFFELIEDAIGSEAMTQFKKEEEGEEEKKNSNQRVKRKKFNS
tara:strand:- start:738 stop:887 length:150 start_codon:yes stop_codon:yes gene_type:complete